MLRRHRSAEQFKNETNRNITYLHMIHTACKMHNVVSLPMFLEAKKKQKNPACRHADVILIIRKCTWALLYFFSLTGQGCSCAVWKSRTSWAAPKVIFGLHPLYIRRWTNYYYKSCRGHTVFENNHAVFHIIPFRILFEISLYLSTGRRSRKVFASRFVQGFPNPFRSKV